MSTETPPTPPPSAPDASKAGEIPLEDIDKILQAEDPEFAKSLEEVRSVETDKTVAIEAEAIDEAEVKIEEKPTRGFRRLWQKLKDSIASAKVRAKGRLIQFAKASLIWLKTRPKEYALYSIVLIKAAIKQANVPIKAYQKAERATKVTVLILILMAIASSWVLLHNMRGIWLPQLTEPILRQFAPYADWVEAYDPKEEGESFYAAFPQERHEFLFKKIKVNLKRSAENLLPMGAFEVIVLLDSKDTAIEVRDREVEFWDLLQRVFEEETFVDLESELGKAKVKAKLKREMNQKLTQGWVKDVNFKTFILKP